MRVKSIDTLRGFTICTMFAANFIKLFASDPPLLLDHALPGRVLPFDLVAPLFGFMMGICLPFTIEQGRASPGRMARRVTALFALGYLPNFTYRLQNTGGSVGETLLSTWGILETWAVAYALIYLLSHLPRRWRPLVLLVMLGLYSVAITQNPDVARTILARQEGGIFAAPAWTFVAGAGMLVGEALLWADARQFPRVSGSLAALLLGSGLALHWWVQPMIRLAVNPAYILFSAGASVFFFLLVHQRGLDLGHTVRAIGRWPLLAWLTQGLVYIPVNYTVGLHHFGWPAAGVLAAGSLFLVLGVTVRLVRAGLTFRV